MTTPPAGQNHQLEVLQYRVKCTLVQKFPRLKEAREKLVHPSRNEQKKRTLSSSEEAFFRNSGTQTESFCGVELKNHFGKMP